LYLVRESLGQEDRTWVWSDEKASWLDPRPRGFVSEILRFLTCYKQLFETRRLRNALISSSTVALAQQLCGSESPNSHDYQRPTITCIVLTWSFLANILALKTKKQTPTTTTTNNTNQTNKTKRDTI